jgi:hypothetical protein
MPDPRLQKHYCVAAAQQRVSYNIIVKLASSQMAAANAPVRGCPGRVHIESLAPPTPASGSSLSGRLVCARGRNRKNAPGQPDEWPIWDPEPQEKTPRRADVSLRHMEESDDE